MDPTRRFSSLVENYARYRPGYPDGVLDVLRERCGLGEAHVVADVGSGTGALARMLLKNGNRVFGVEPNPEMRRAGERLLAGYDGFTSVAGTAEKTTLPDGCADFAAAGQAFHWFDPRPTREEFVRILRPGGRVVLVWNTRQTAETGFMAAYEELVEAHGTDYAQVNQGRRGSPEEVGHFFAPSPVETVVLENAQTLTSSASRGACSLPLTCLRRESQGAPICWPISKTSFIGTSRTAASLCATTRVCTSAGSRAPEASVFDGRVLVAGYTLAL